MKKLILLVLSVLFILMMVACVDYSAMQGLAVQSEAPGPTASQEAMVRQSAYEELLNKYNDVNGQLDMLTEAQDAKEQSSQEMIDDNTALNTVVSDVQLSVYRSVISKETLGAFFGMVTGAEKLENGDVVLTVQALNVANEAVDASLYDESVIKEIYRGLTLEAQDTQATSFIVLKDTMVAYNGETHIARDSGFFTYVSSEITSAKAVYDTNSEANATLLPGPVFIFLAMGDDVVMILEK